MEDHEKLNEIFTRYLADQCTREEVHLLLQYFNTDENESLIKNLIKTELESTDNLNREISPEAKETLENVLKNIKKRIEGSE